MRPKAESEPVRSQMIASLLLLPTPSRDDAIAVGYKLRRLGEDFHLSDQVRSQAHERRPLGRHAGLKPGARGCALATGL
jgi:hypothetical protein